MIKTLNTSGGKKCGKRDGEEVHHRTTPGQKDHSFRATGSLKELSWEKCNRNPPRREPSYRRPVLFVWILSVTEQPFREQVSTYYGNYSQPRWAQQLLRIPGFQQIWERFSERSNAGYEEVRRRGRQAGLAEGWSSIWNPYGQLQECLLFFVYYSECVLSPSSSLRLPLLFV